MNQTKCFLSLKGLVEGRNENREGLIYTLRNSQVWLPTSAKNCRSHWRFVRSLILQFGISRVAHNLIETYISNEILRDMVGRLPSILDSNFFNLTTHVLQQPRFTFKTQVCNNRETNNETDQTKREKDCKEVKMKQN